MVTMSLKKLKEERLKMKKILSLALVLVMVLSVVALVGCSGKEKTDGDDAAPTLKFGVGIVASYAKATDATAEKNGVGEFDAEIVAVLVDADGKIVKCVLDSIKNEVGFTAEGKAVELGEFKTKYELGAEYGMATSEYATDLNGDGEIKEWNEQADIFVKAVEGKTLEEAKALMTETSYGVEELQTAGCTISIGGFINALDKAVTSATDVEATADAKLKIGVVTSGKTTDAEGIANGSIKLDMAISAAVLGADNKVVSIISDAIEAEFLFDSEGVSKTDASQVVKTKLEKGDDYGMDVEGAYDANQDGVVKEWYEQAAAFDAACVGKDAKGIAALEGEKGLGVEDLQTAGCTIAIKDMVAAAVKASTVA